MHCGLQWQRRAGKLFQKSFRKVNCAGTLCTTTTGATRSIFSPSCICHGAITRPRDSREIWYDTWRSRPVTNSQNEPKTLFIYVCIYRVIKIIRYIHFLLKILKCITWVLKSRNKWLKRIYMVRICKHWLDRDV